MPNIRTANKNHKRTIAAQRVRDKAAKTAMEAPAAKTADIAKPAPAKAASKKPAKAAK